MFSWEELEFEMEARIPSSLVHTLPSVFKSYFDSDSSSSSIYESNALEDT